MATWDVLWEEAVDQHGYVSLPQAKSLGVTRAAIDMLLARGRLEHAAAGVYRIPLVPATPYDPYQLAVFWTGSDQACLSHDTALDAYDVCDINPTEIHLTLPPGRPIRRAGGQRYLVHHEPLTKDQIGWWQGIATVTLATALDQCIRNGTPTYLLRQALATAADRGSISPTTQATLEYKLDSRDGP